MAYILLRGPTGVAGVRYAGGVIAGVRYLRSHIIYTRWPVRPAGVRRWMAGVDALLYAVLCITQYATYVGAQ